MLKQFDIWNWTLEPFEKFGPISLIDLDRKKLIELMGPPTEDLTKDGSGRLIWDTPEYQLFAWITSEKIDNILIPGYPILVHMRTQKRDTRVPKEHEQIPTWMEKEDALALNKKIGSREYALAPTMGILWDDEVQCLCIFTQSRRIHLLQNENYFTASVEALRAPQFEKELKDLRLQHPKIFQDSWSPVLIEGAAEKKGLPRCQYGGLPWLAEGERYPACKVCNESLPLLTQIDLSYLPEVLQKRFGNEGLFQLFHCGTEDCLCRHSDPDDPPNLIYLCRILKEKNLKLASVADIEPIPHQQIVDWFKEPDGPQDDELEQALGKSLEEIFSGDLGEEYYRFQFPYTTNKWGGHPSWVQGEDITELLPQCPDCKDRMQVDFVTQYNSNDDFTCGDGRIFAFQCAKHKDRFLVMLET